MKDRLKRRSISRENNIFGAARPVWWTVVRVVPVRDGGRESTVKGSTNTRRSCRGELEWNDGSR